MYEIPYGYFCCSGHCALHRIASFRTKVTVSAVVDTVHSIVLLHFGQK